LETSYEGPYSGTIICPGLEEGPVYGTVWVTGVSCYVDDSDDDDVEQLDDFGYNPHYGFDGELYYGDRDVLGDEVCGDVLEIIGVDMRGEDVHLYRREDPVVGDERMLAVFRMEGWRTFPFYASRRACIIRQIITQPWKKPVEVEPVVVPSVADVNVGVLPKWKKPPRT